MLRGAARYHIASRAKGGQGIQFSQTVPMQDVHWIRNGMIRSGLSDAMLSAARWPGAYKHQYLGRLVNVPKAVASCCIPCRGGEWDAMLHSIDIKIPPGKDEPRPMVLRPEVPS